MNELKTTFWSDFTIADKFGASAVLDTHKRAFEAWCDNVDYMKEFVMVLNHKIWQYHEKDDELFKLYSKLWAETDNWCMDYFAADEAAIQEYISFLD